MSRFAPSTPPRVRVSDCFCPGTPHEGGDFVTLEPILTIDGGLAAAQAIKYAAATGGDVLAAMLEASVPYQILAWDFLDFETGKPLEINAESVREALPYDKGGKEVALKAFELYYSNAVVTKTEDGEKADLTPLPSEGSQTPTDEPSPPTPTAKTSAARTSSGKRRAPSASSLDAPTAGDS